MDLYLQMGHGMMEHAQELIKKWNGGVVILSPRDTSLKQMQSLSKKLKIENGDIVVDPQFYLPRADHDKLIAHSFWPNQFETSTFFSGNGLQNMLRILWHDYNEKLGTKFFILPGQFSSKIDRDWEKMNHLIIEESSKLSISIPVFATICMSSDILRSEDQIHEILDYVESWDVAGFYIVPQHPKNQYLVEDAIWLANLLDFCAGLKIIQKEVVVGYCNHQNLCLSAAKVDAIASGTWVNVRMFPLEKFNNPEEPGGRRSVWYYCPQTLSEYQITYLDIAQKVGLLKNLKTDGSYNSNFADILFTGAQPTTVNFSEREAFRHYLQCLKVQSTNSSSETFNLTIDGLLMQLEAAGQLMASFRSKGIRGKYRDFSEVLDINISAIDAFKNVRGFVLNKKWDSI